MMDIGNLLIESTPGTGMAVDDIEDKVPLRSTVLAAAMAQ